MNPKVEVGQEAPGFELPDQEGALRSLADERGRWVLLYFYPKDATPGCTKEACGIREAWADYESAGLAVYGASPDSVDSHARFAARHDLPFPLLADVDLTLANAYGVYGTKTFMGRSFEGVHRMSFLIDPEGRIAKVYEKVRPSIHARQVLDDLEELKSRDPA